jgi:NAD(P)-dependent dehydrogenase (short-subunit alcohol dehydrogenase family)
MTRRAVPATRSVSRPPEEDWAPAVEKPLRGQVALVAGATRGAGRAIAVSLGLAGATVYASGRSARGHPATPGRPETIEETAEMIRSYGGRAYAVRADHTVEADVQRLVRRLARREHGRLDILVNDIWGGEELTEWGRPPWTMTYRLGRTMLERGVLSHILTSRYAVPLLVKRKRGIVFEITDGDHQHYRGSLFYDLVKTSVIRLALALHEEFVEAGLSHVSAVAVTPGFLRSEYMLDQFGVKEENWRDAIPKARHFFASETPYFLGRAIVALAADRRVHAKSGKVYGSWTLAKEYGFTDRDGTRPDWGKVFYGEILGEG